MRYFLFIILFQIQLYSYAQSISLVSAPYVNSSVFTTANNAFDDGISFMAMNKNVHIAGNKIALNIAHFNYSFSQSRANIGAFFQNQQLDLFNQNQMSLNFSYKINLGQGSFVSNLGYLYSFQNYSQLNVLDDNDEFHPINQLNSSSNAGLQYSFAYKNKHFNSAISGIEVFERHNIIFKNQYNALLKYQFNVSLKDEIQATIFARYNQSENFVNDYLLQLNHNKLFSLGLGWRSSNTLLSLVELQINKLVKKIPQQLTLAYLFDAGIGNNAIVGNEIMLKYFIHNDTFTKRYKKLKNFKSPVLF